MEHTYTPPTLKALKSLRKPVRNINIAHKENLSQLEKLAVSITEKVGTMGFFILILVWTAFWISWNIAGPVPLQFDPYPAFVMWLFVSNMIQIFLMPLIMVGQNLQGKHTEARAEADFDINTKAEREIEVILQHLENQNDLILRILHRVEEKEENK